MAEISIQPSQHEDTYTWYDVLLDQVTVGRAVLRKVPTKADVVPDGFENHIYYEVAEEFRGRGIATRALALLLDEARNINLPEVIINVKDSNIASQKVIENNGGILKQTATGTDRNVYRKYLISLSD